MRSPAVSSRTADPRALALELLLRVEQGGRSDLLVGEALARTKLAPRDAALATRLVYGTLTWQGRLDWTLEPICRRPLAELEPAVRAVLRMGLFQLSMLDRVPAFAAIDTSVELVKRPAGRGAASLVNAVLRRAARDGGTRPLPAREAGVAKHLSVKWSHPEWLVALWLEELGEARCETLLEANCEPAPTVARVNPNLRTREQAIAELAALGLAARSAEHAPGAIVIDTPVACVVGQPWLGLQSEASQLVALLVGAVTGAERILDACAAPGGKTSAIAERMPSAGSRLVAGDRSLAGVRRVRAGAERAAPGRVATLAADATAPPFPPATFDAVLLDAPCSGLGTLRSHPEIRWRRRPGDLLELARAQGAMLAAVAPLVRPGGRLIYSTCTLVAAENESVVAEFLGKRRDFQLVDARRHLPAEASVLVAADGTLRTAPDQGGLDGFFAARLERSRDDLDSGTGSRLTSASRSTM